jgi:hypothetical protein
MVLFCEIMWKNKDYTHTHTQNMWQFLLFHCSNACTNALRCYFYITVTLLLYSNMACFNMDSYAKLHRVLHCTLNYLLRLSMAVLKSGSRVYRLGR